MPRRELLVGVARAEITPPIGVHLAGTLRDGPSTAVDRALHVTVLAVSDGHTEVAIVAFDLLMLPVEVAGAIRREIGEVIRMPPSHILANVSHTHAVPPHPSWMDPGGESTPAEIRTVATYFETAQARAVSAAKDAHAMLRPARSGFAVGAARIGVNRRERLPDGTMVLGENANGIVDPTVGVIRFDDMRGQPIAMLLHYACHPDVLGPKATLISPDYVGAARSVAERVIGAPVLFLQGAAGDIDPRVGIVNGPDGVDEMNRLGTELGCEAARVFQSVNTVRRRGQRVSWQSAVSVVTGWDYVDVTTPSVEHLSASSLCVELPLRPLPSIEMAKEMFAEAMADLERIKALPSGLPLRLVAGKRAHWASIQLQAALAHRAPLIEVEIQAIRLNDIAIVGIPGELFVEIGLAIKQRSPIPHTLVCGYSNGVLFYIPTSQAFAEGGYEVESYINYLQPMGPTPEWEMLIEKAALRVLSDVSRRSTAA